IVRCYRARVFTSRVCRHVRRGVRATRTFPRRGSHFASAERAQHAAREKLSAVERSVADGGCKFQLRHARRAPLMKRSLLVIFGGLLCGVLAHVGWFTAHRPPAADNLAAQLAWMQESLQLTL